MSTEVNTLRRAAALMRSRALPATRGPWSILSGANGNVWHFPDEDQPDQVPRFVVRRAAG